MKDTLLRIIRKIQGNKKEKKIAPDYATYVEITHEVVEEVKQNLNEMVKEKKLKFNRTLNDIAFYENDRQENIDA